MTDNPFWVPHQVDQGDPLRPWKFEEHEHYYVDVDGTAEAYEKFKQAFRELDLLREGRLVVAAGDKGCGKTSLLNRGAAWLKKRLIGQGQTPVIIDLTHLATTLDMEARLKQVQHTLITKLDEQGIHVYPEKTPAADRDTFYTDVESALRTFDAILLLLVPRHASIPLLEELIAHATYVRERMVILCETLSASEVHTNRGRLTTTHGRFPVELQVSGLRAKDFWAYAEQRQKSVGGGTIASRTTMRAVNTEPAEYWTIKRLHLLISKAYDDKLKTSASAAEHLTIREIHDCQRKMLMSEVSGL